MKPSERTAPPRDTATAASPARAGSPAPRLARISFATARQAPRLARTSSATSCAPTSPPAGTRRWSPAFRPSPTATCTSATPSRSASTSGSPREFGGDCNLRFDDTNPLTEDLEYVEAIQRDVRWLGFDWGDALYFASDYFERLYELAELLVEQGPGLRRQPLRGGDPRPPRHRHRGRAAEPLPRPLAWTRTSTCCAGCAPASSPDGAAVLRARIDMAAANMKMRDPLLYRIRHAEHYRRGSAWCIYPMYDFTHPLSDAIEGITHSLCTLEFENNRELYDWLLAAVDWPEPRPHQYEFARLNLNYTVMSKRKLLAAGRGGAGGGLGRPAHADALRACAGAATRRRRSATSATASASPRRTARSTWRCSSTPCARTSTPRRRACCACCGRSSW